MRSIRKKVKKSKKENKSLRRSYKNKSRTKKTRTPKRSQRVKRSKRSKGVKRSKRSKRIRKNTMKGGSAGAPEPYLDQKFGIVLTAHGLVFPPTPRDGLVSGDPLLDGLSLDKDLLIETMKTEYGLDFKNPPLNRIFTINKLLTEDNKGVFLNLFKRLLTIIADLLKLDINIEYVMETLEEKRVMAESDRWLEESGELLKDTDSYPDLLKLDINIEDVMETLEEKRELKLMAEAEGWLEESGKLLKDTARYPD